MNMLYKTAFMSNDKIKMDKDDFASFIIDYNLPLFIDDDSEYTIYETKWVIKE